MSQTVFAIAILEATIISYALSPKVIIIILFKTGAGFYGNTLQIFSVLFELVSSLSFRFRHIFIISSLQISHTQTQTTTTATRIAPNYDDLFIFFFIIIFTKLLSFNKKNPLLSLINCSVFRFHESFFLRL